MFSLLPAAILGRVHLTSCLVNSDCCALVVALVNIGGVVVLQGLIHRQTSFKVVKGKCTVVLVLVLGCCLFEGLKRRRTVDIQLWVEC